MVLKVQQKKEGCIHWKQGFGFKFQFFLKKTWIQQQPFNY